MTSLYVKQSQPVNMWEKHPCRHQGHKERGGWGGPCTRAEIPLQSAMNGTVRMLLSFRDPCWSSSWRTAGSGKGRTLVGEKNQCSWLLGGGFFTPKKEVKFWRALALKLLSILAAESSQFLIEKSEKLWHKKNLTKLSLQILIWMKGHWSREPFYERTKVQR